MPLYKKVQAKLDRILGITRENLDGARVIRAFNQEEEEAARFHKEHTELTRLQLFVGKLSALMNPLTYVIINGATLILIWTGALQVNAGSITPVSYTHLGCAGASPIGGSALCKDKRTFGLRKKNRLRRQRFFELLRV